FDKSGKSNVSRDPGWARLFKWQKSLIDYYGYDKLVRWQTGAGDEFSASHAFEVGKLAMMLDGEWRVSFIKHEHPDLQYGTAPMPVDDAQPNLYGSGYINGTIIGIPKTGKNHDQAWALVKYLTTNNHFLAQFSNDIRNVPSTVSSSKSSELLPDKNFIAFLLVMSVYLSFTHYDLLNAPRWIGLANYKYMFGDDWHQIRSSIYNTLWIIVVGVPLQVLFSFGIAVMLTRARLGVGFFRTIFYLPALAPPVA